MTPSEIHSRLFDALVSEIHKRWPEYLHSRFTVAEIYQNLIPWRTHRDTMGIANSGEYEQALLRLLAGEGDYLTLESKAARDEIQAELECRSPNTGIYRDFAAVGVRLNQSRLPLPNDGAARQATVKPDAIGRHGFVAGEREPDTNGGAAFDLAAPGGAQAAPGSEVCACAGCTRELPGIEGVQFCPFCGQNVRVVACLACGMKVEADWTYCVGCGTRAER